MTAQIKLTYAMQWIAVFTVIAAIGVGYWAFERSLYCFTAINAVTAVWCIVLFIWQGRIRKRLEGLQS